MQTLLRDYFLFRIDDSQSTQKSPPAIQLVENILNRRYSVDYYIIKDRTTCENSFQFNPNYSKKKCGHGISDVFYIKHANTGEIKRLGNHCISTVLDPKDYQDICTTLNIRHICFFCDKPIKSDSGFHKTCMAGNSSNMDRIRQRSIKTFNRTLKALMKYFDIHRLFEYITENGLHNLETARIETIFHSKKNLNTREKDILLKLIERYAKITQLFEQNKKQVSSNTFLESLHSFFQSRKFLTDKQYDCLMKTVRFSSK